MNNLIGLSLRNNLHCAQCLLKRTTWNHMNGKWIDMLCMRDTRYLLTIAARKSTFTGNRDEWIKPEGYNTGIHIYNSLTKRKDELILPRGNHLSWYICGPTVYDKSHAGHASNYVRYDIIRRILQNFFNINVTFLMGITDIDDKIIRRTQELETDMATITNYYEREFFQEMLALNILPPTIVSRVTDNIQEIIAFIQGIVDKGHAYKASDGSVYFDVQKFGRYNMFMPEEPPHPDSAIGVKRGPKDFALWKAVKPAEPSWESPWGSGRPGWHIECSAMASRVFGSTIDIHCGGTDLMFPHHENELAQSCSFHDVGQWANYWMHTGFLHMKFDPEKMSKSLKNTYSTATLTEKYTANQFRMFCMLTNYGNNIEFHPEIMEKAIGLDQKIGNFLRLCDAYIKGQLTGGYISETETLQRMAQADEKIMNCFRDNFNTSTAIQELLDLIQYMTAGFARTDKVCRSPGTVGAVNVYIKRMCKQLGFHKKGWKMSKEPDNMMLKEVLDATIKFRYDVRNISLKTDLLLPETMNKKEGKVEKQRVFGPVLDCCDEFRTKLSYSKISVQDHKTYSSWEFDDTHNMADDSTWEDTDSDVPQQKHKTQDKQNGKKSA